MEEVAVEVLFYCLDILKIDNRHILVKEIGREDYM
jgi:hypothetical protein